ncbi:MAG: hypothetical protein GF418_03290 [Chitinivibrionales bacterium]|nr:hypothetical protein [Chitinivibrionales bacterium]MBD3394627.1 hypothetical protein [Chitinivibrionales bacterium]
MARFLHEYDYRPETDHCGAAGIGVDRGAAKRYISPAWNSLANNKLTKAARRSHTVAKNELVSLALLYDQPKHAYAINSIIKDIGLEHWAHLSRASIYSTLLRLQKQGCVKVTSAKVGRTPPRKIYAITAKGRKRLHDEQVAALRATVEPDSLFPLGTTFLFGMPPTEARAHCKARITDLKSILSHLDEEHDSYEGCEMEVALMVIRAARKHIHVEIESTRELMNLLRRRPRYYDDLLAGMKEHYKY